MIISDLKYFEEVVAEVPRILGGDAETLTLGQLYPEFATELKEAGFGTLVNTQLNVIPGKVNTSGGTTSAVNQIEHSSSASSFVGK